MENILEVKNLKTYFNLSAGTAKAVDDISFSIKKGASFGLVGESGCGKSVTALSVMRLIEPPGEIVSGEALFDGSDLLKKSGEEIRRIRGDKISMIFQEPMTSLNPVFNVGEQITEAMRLHLNISRKESYERAVDMLKLVGIPAPERRINSYPNQLSGGMRQRVMIAMALSCNPALLIADEPTTALDVTIQAQILDLIQGLKEKLGMSMLLITHDLGIVAENVANVAIMYAGKIVEHSTTEEVLSHPKHPYTAGLLQSLPALDESGTEDKKAGRLNTIAGVVPHLLNLPEGCLFKTRCPLKEDVCDEPPPYKEVCAGHFARCWKV
jgi:peptide/nickel transport system ATP-binding protein/oligopeptide transport system ATP-binding protein